MPGIAAARQKLTFDGSVEPIKCITKRGGSYSIRERLNGCFLVLGSN